MITRIRNSRWVKSIAMLMIFQIVFPLVVPPEAHAITGGPSQPEFTTFTPVGVSDMVDPFTGDFSYNIPLMDVGGYPINISYSSGIGMEQQASNVGLGWTLNAGGAVTRSMRGIPDDFNGSDKITTETNLKPNITVGANLTITPEVIGKDKVEAAQAAQAQAASTPTPSSGDSDENNPYSLSTDLSFGFGIFHNNYSGLGVEAKMKPSFALAAKNKPTYTFGLGLSANSQQGIGLEVPIGMQTEGQKKVGEETKITRTSLSLGASYNSRAGLRSISIDRSYARTIDNSAKKNNGIGIRSSNTIPVGVNTYIPQIGHSMRTASVAANIASGFELAWVTGKFKVDGYFNSQSLRRPDEVRSAYGFLYADEGKDNPDAMHDFNREKDGAFTKNTPALPMTQMTYDVYTVSGQGVGGMFRPHRDFATVYDPKVRSNTGSGGFGGDLAAGAVFKGGANLNVGYGFSSSGKWSNGNNETKDKLSFNNRSDSDDPALYEPFYMKAAGEFTTFNQDYFDKIQGFDPVRVDITKLGKTKDNYWKRVSDDADAEAIINGIDDNIREGRDKRNQTMTLLPAELAQFGALDRQLLSYVVDKETGETLPATELKDRIDTNFPYVRKKHHISEVLVDRPDGARYIYGNQTYNISQKEVSFNVYDEDYTPDVATGTVVYNATINPPDNTPGNKKGTDHFFSSTELPPYATAYLLTTIVSPDYVDLKGDGATPDDLGTYTKFNYRTLHSEGAPYKWRNPYPANTANLSEGHKARLADDKGNYIYGTKEIKMLETIETKNYIAEFHYSNRKDAYEVAGKNGGQGTKTLEKLDKIKLYTRCDREENKGNAVPLKTVHFIYDYSLCQGIPSNNGVDPTGLELEANGGSEIDNQDGKLTLKKIYFTYEDSKKGQLSPYEFHYSGAGPNGIAMQPELNPNYEFRGNDRWGNYKPNDGDLPNTDAPYVNQDAPPLPAPDEDKTVTDLHAAAWNLTTIQLPSGGLINVELEADDYAYVQNKRATRMFQVLGFSDSPNYMEGVDSYLYEKEDNYLYMHFNAPMDNFIDPSATPEQKIAEFKKRYIGEGKDEIKELFYKFLIDITGGGRYEYIPGYANVLETGWADGKGWIRLEPTTLKDRQNSDEIHPIAKTAIQFMRINLPNFTMDKNLPDNASADDKLNGLVGFLQDAKSLLMGVNKALRTRNVGRHVDIEKSFVRLQTPNYKKLGGGLRVSKITINDQWGKMSVDDPTKNFEYGQTYSYNMISQDATSSISVGTEISSGVAVYEPFIGNEENPLRQPNAYTDDHMFAPDNAYYQEMPYGEMFFPSPSVGYSQVTVKNLEHEGVTRTATGHIVHEFYTAKDFPVKVKAPLLKSKKLPVANLGRLLGTAYVDYQTCSQSYAIELNDMHGKPKAQRVYAEGQEDPISSVKYFYKQDGSTLDNNITVIGKDGKTETARAGVDIDMIIDERQSKNFMSTVGLEFNGDVSPIPFIPPVLPLPSVWVSANIEDTRFRSIANTKVITRYGILEKTVAEDLGSHVTTENLAWDSETGEVLLTRTENDFEDPVFAFSYPAHWAYDDMGQAYRNIDALVALDESNLDEYLVPGDELLIPYESFVSDPPTTSFAKVWVREVESNGVTLVTRNGEEFISNDEVVKVIRSGRRNQQSTPVGSITTLSNPIASGTLNFNDVINAGAVEFKDEWGDFCLCSEDLTSTNPYVNGKKGSYRPVRSHAYLTDRNQPDDLASTNIRIDGTFDGFDPFWNPNGGGEWTIDDGDWTFASEVTLISPYGLELENKDALGRYSAADYKYNHTLPTAVASNSRYKEMGYDNFEDYGCGTCTDDHFSFKESVADGDIVDTQSHTGRRSIKVSANETVEIEKVIVPCSSGGEIQ